MSLETDIVAHLGTFAGLAALIGTRVYQDERPQGAIIPHVVFTRIATPRWQALGSGSPVLASNPLYQFTVWATTITNRNAIAVQLRLAITDFATNHAACAIFADERTGRDAESGLYRRDIDARILHAGA
jgi:hypothetical protein